MMIHLCVAHVPQSTPASEQNQSEHTPYVRYHASAAATAAAKHERKEKTKTAARTGIQQQKCRDIVAGTRFYSGPSERAALALSRSKKEERKKRGRKGRGGQQEVSRRRSVAHHLYSETNK